MTELEQPDAAWAAKMTRRKAFHEVKVAERTLEKGLLIVHTGAGKGKTTAALGLILRAVGHGQPVGMVQFIKGAWHPGELAALARFDDLVTVRTMGEGFTWDQRDRSRQVSAARSAWSEAKVMIGDPRYRLIVLDELSIVLRYGFLAVTEVVSGLCARGPNTHIVVTGRQAPTELLAAADLITDMRSVKHPHQAGVMAQAGIEY